MTASWEQTWIWAGGAALGALLVGLAYRRDLPVAFRVLGQFLFLIALPLGLVFGGGLWLFASVVSVDESVWPALVAGTVIATGWLTTSVFAELERRRAKDERLRDYHKALYAEIGSALEVMYADGRAEEFAEDIVVRMKADETFIPFIPRESHDRIFAAIEDEIEILPRQTIDTVISFYKVMGSMGSLADDMRGRAYRELEQDRRISVYIDYFEHRKRAFALGQYALGLIKAYADKGAAGAEAHARRFNTPDAGLSLPSEGSE